jgi:hypothetical protein
VKHKVQHLLNPLAEKVSGDLRAASSKLALKIFSKKP